MRYLFNIVIVISVFCLNTIRVQAQNISSFDKNVIEQRILEKVNDFFSYLPEIAGKGSGDKDARQLALKYVDKALNLFLGEGMPFKYFDESGEVRHHAVSISISKGDKVRTLSLRRYLKRLLAVPYEKISFDKCEAIRIEEEPIVVDSVKYLAVASVVLVQNDSVSDKLYINDNGAKRIKAYIQRKVVKTPVGEDVFWIAKLGDISIKEDEK